MQKKQRKRDFRSRKSKYCPAFRRRSSVDGVNIEDIIDEAALEVPAFTNLAALDAASGAYGSYVSSASGEPGSGGHEGVQETASGEHRGIALHAATIAGAGAQIASYHFRDENGFLAMDIYNNWPGGTANAATAMDLLVEVTVNGNIREAPTQAFTTPTITPYVLWCKQITLGDRKQSVQRPSMYQLSRLHHRPSTMLLIGGHRSS